MFHGSTVALVTPMHPNGEIDWLALAALIEWHIAAGTQAIVIAGTTGESATLDVREKQKLFTEAVRIAKERIPIIAGTGTQGTAQTIKLSQMAMSCGVDACLIMTPAYIKPTQEGLYQHYMAVADQVAEPIILYNVPSRTAVDLLPETVARLANKSNIIGIKEATADLTRYQALKALCGDKIDIYSGDDATALAFMLEGAKGVISVTANIEPEKMRQLCDLAKTNPTQAREQDKELQHWHKNLFIESNPIPVKWVLSARGKIQGGIRLPLTPLSPEHQKIFDSQAA